MPEMTDELFRKLTGETPEPGFYLVKHDLTDVFPTRFERLAVARSMQDEGMVILFRDKDGNWKE